MNEPRGTGFDDRDLDPLVLEALAGMRMPGGMDRRVMASTLPVLRRRRRLRRGTFAVLAAAVYAVGVMSAGIVGRGARPSATGALRVSAAAGTEIVRDVGSPNVTGRDEFVNPVALRAAVRTAPRAEQAGLLIRAGDLYLQQGYDLRGAMDCYRQAFELGGAGISDDGAASRSWLFAALQESGTHGHVRGEESVSWTTRTRQ